MQLERSFTVAAPIERVWDTLMDFQRVAGAVPGAQVLAAVDGDHYQVAMKVKLGPVTMQYKGNLKVAERDAGQHRAVMQGSAQETRGQGTAQATVTLLLAEAAGQTRASVNADLSLSGKAAAMGKSVIGSVTDQMLAVFTQNLQDMLGPAAAVPAGASVPAAAPEPEPAPVPAAAPEREPSADVDPVPVPAPVPEAAPQPEPQPPSTSASPARQAVPPPFQGSLDGLALARGVVRDQLGSPVKVLGLLMVVAGTAYGLGLRAGHRSRL